MLTVRESSPFVSWDLRGSWVDHAASSTDSISFASIFSSRCSASRSLDNRVSSHRQTSIEHEAWPTAYTE